MLCFLPIYNCSHRIAIKYDTKHLALSHFIVFFCWCPRLDVLSRINRPPQKGRRFPLWRKIIRHGTQKKKNSLLYVPERSACLCCWAEIAGRRSFQSVHKWDKDQWDAFCVILMDFRRPIQHLCFVVPVCVCACVWWHTLTRQTHARRRWRLENHNELSHGQVHRTPSSSYTRETEASCAHKTYMYIYIIRSYYYTNHAASLLWTCIICAYISIVFSGCQMIWSDPFFHQLRIRF